MFLAKRPDNSRLGGLPAPERIIMQWSSGGVVSWRQALAPRFPHIDGPTRLCGSRGMGADVELGDDALKMGLSSYKGSASPPPICKTLRPANAPKRLQPRHTEVFLGIVGLGHC